MATWLETNGQIYMEMMCAEAGHTVTNSQLSRPLQVHGVGRQASECTLQRTFPIAPLVQDGHGGQHTLSTYTAPVIPNSPVPALLGLASLRANRAILECEPGLLRLCGPGRQPLQLPAGSRTYQLEESPSGHWLLPCSELHRIPCSSAADTVASRMQAADDRMDFQAAQQPPSLGTSTGVPSSTSD